MDRFTCCWTMILRKVLKSIIIMILLYLMWTEAVNLWIYLYLMYSISEEKQINITFIIVFECLNFKIESGFLLWLYQECIDVTTSYVQCLHTYLWLLQYSNCSNMNVMMHYNWINSMIFNVIYKRTQLKQYGSIYI